MKRIVLTGGGSAGHVTPHLALLPKLQEIGWDLHYIGTYDGIERQLIEGKIPYYAISAGKLRRYFHAKNFTDPFRVLKGVLQAFRILVKLKPSVVFSKGGFVSVPVAIAAKVLKIPVILHESDLTPGLANKLALPFATHLCVTFPETLNYVPKEKATLTGNPIREELFSGNADTGRQICGFTNNKPIVLVMGGSLGSVIINQTLRSALPGLGKSYQIIHVCGKGNTDSSIHVPGYVQFEYVGEELPHLFAAADLVVSRAGANALFELLALVKPHLLIPLSKAASRGDQLLNAKSFAKQGFSKVLPEEELSADSLIVAIKQLYEQRNQYIGTMRSSRLSDSSAEVLKVIQKHTIR